MSDQTVKQKRSKRIHSDETAVSRQVKIAKQHKMDPAWSKDVREPHRLAKKHAMDCGNPKCMLCGNPRKTFKELTIQEKRFYQDDEFHAYHGIDSEDTEVPNTRSS